jgi:hypothetical protein
MNNLRENILLNILLLGSGIYVIVALTILTGPYLKTPNPYFWVLATSTVIVFIFFCYLLWVKVYATKVLVLGDNTSDSEKLLTHNDGILLGEKLRAQIIPKALFKQESPRARFQLKTFKGSFFAPPRILISMNICSLVEANEAELVIKSMQLNRVFELLRHKSRTQKIDVVFNHMDKLVGYREFKNATDNAMNFWSYLPLAPQLLAAQNTTQALLENHTSQFFQFLNFAHKIPDLSSAIDTLLADLLLVDKEAGSHVYFLTS